MYEFLHSLDRMPERPRSLRPFGSGWLGNGAASHRIGNDFDNLVGGKLQSAGNGALGHAFVGQIDDGPVPVDRLAGGVHGGI